MRSVKRSQLTLHFPVPRHVSWSEHEMLEQCDLRLALLGLGFVACGHGESQRDAAAIATTCDDATILSFVVDAQEATGEEYVCFGFDAAPLDGRSVRAIRWTTPPQGPVVLHHAKLYATAEALPAGAVPCDPMPSDAAGLHVWAPGGTSLELPDGIALSLPQGTRTLIVEAHALILASGVSEPARCELCPSSAADHAAWLGVQAPVPAIRPYYVETASSRCVFARDFHMLSSWPHMHRIGKEFHGALVRAAGTREPLVDVVPWIFDEQRTYAITATVNAGDSVETNCVWENPTDAYVLPGPLTSDEMCNQGIIGYPADAASCVTQ